MLDKIRYYHYNNNMIYNKLNKESETMTKENWLNHMEDQSFAIENNIKAPSHGGNLEDWKRLLTNHKMCYPDCSQCKDRARTRKANKRAKTERKIMKDLGLTRVIGSVSGKVYYE